MGSETNETETWERARRNDGEAFGILFDLHRDRIYHRALGLMGSVHDADDVVAAAFFELWRRRKSVRLVGGSVLPWLLVTTVNISRNAHRSTARYRRLLSTIPHRETASGPEIDDRETHHRLASSLRQLTPADAALFVLTVLEDLPMTKAAEIVGLTPATARVRLHRARVRLRAELSDLNPTIRPAIEGNH
jgi:RNA polymerase sigma factor (sigma-70 family)